MALTAEEREAVRYHLGYPEISAATVLQGGIPTPVTPYFMLESALDHLVTGGEDRVRNILRVLVGIEQKLVDAQDYLAAASIESITLRGAEPGRTHTDLLEREATRWATRLANVLAVPLYPGANRFGGRSINARVIN
jgi:hypothetical protein